MCVAADNQVDFIAESADDLADVAVAAIGGGYWWYTNKYLPSKAAGR